MKDSIKIITFYKFVNLPNHLSLRQIIQQTCINLQVKGTILLSPEGINATVAGAPDKIDQLIELLSSYNEFKDMGVQVSYHASYPFRRLKVKLKQQLFNLGIPEISPEIQTGTYVQPENWNSLISDPNTITIDARNHYEVAIGCFKYAVNPNINTFSQFPNYFLDNFSKLNKDHKIAMYCTGGIRCEKSTAYLLKLGFKQVYHLKGGILNYLSKIPKQISLWQGDCFLFDQRIGVTSTLQTNNYGMCYGCRHPLNLQDQADPKYKEGIYCPYCFDNISTKTIKRATERKRQILLAQLKISDQKA